MSLAWETVQIIMSYSFKISIWRSFFFLSFLVLSLDHPTYVLLFCLLLGRGLRSVGLGMGNMGLLMLLLFSVFLADEFFADILPPILIYLFFPLPDWFVTLYPLLL